jgi:Ca-activated chloride channel family protein
MGDVVSTASRQTKLELLKNATKTFIQARPNDLIGMIAFSRTPQILSPLTLDHELLLNILGRFDIMRLSNQDGTGIGYAIYKTAHMIAAVRYFAQERSKENKPIYDIKSTMAYRTPILSMKGAVGALSA